MKRRHGKYLPHQASRERARRLRQVRAGQLAGFVKARRQRPAFSFVTESARYAAHGLVAPSDLALVRA